MSSCIIKKGFQKAPFYGYHRDLEQAYDEGTTNGSARGNLPHGLYPRQSLEADVLCLCNEPGTKLHIFSGNCPCYYDKSTAKFHCHASSPRSGNENTQTSCGSMLLLLGREYDLASLKRRCEEE